MIYITIDGALSGTGIRKTHEGGYLEPELLNLSTSLIQRIQNWLSRYEEAHYFEFDDEELVNELDGLGLEICKLVHDELPESKVTYFSAAKLEHIPLKGKEWGQSKGTE